MNQATILPDFEIPALDPSTLSVSQTSLEAGAFFSRSDHGPAAPIETLDMEFWGRLYDLRGDPHQAGEGTALPVNPRLSLPAGDRQTAQAVEEAILAERNRLARELHDAVTQTLFAASLIAEVLPDLWELDEVEAHKSTTELRQLTRAALAEMRTLLFELRPVALHQARFADLLRQLSEAVMGRQGIPIHLQVEGDCELPCDVKVELYRIVQESLNNIVKYAQARQVEIQAQLAAGQVHLEILDDGIGFDPTCVRPGSLGLHIMRERADAIHAHWQITSQPGSGTTVRVDWRA